MNGVTDYITTQPWLDTITTWYVWVDDAVRGLVAQRPHLVRQRGPQPVCSDSEVITLALIIETYFYGREEIGYAFIQQYLAREFPALLNLDRFNARRRDLLALIEALRCYFRDQQVDPTDRVRLVDSAPIPAVTYTRGARCKSVMGSEYFGVVPSKKAKVFGWRLHATVTAQHMIDDWTLAPAAYLDPKVTDALLQDRRDLILLGDKLFNDAELEDRLWRKRQILLLPLRKDNQHHTWPAAVQPILHRVRRQVETTFSILTTAFNVQRPRGRCLAGYVVRIATSLLAFTLSFLMT